MRRFFSLIFLLTSLVISGFSQRVTTTPTPKPTPTPDPEKVKAQKELQENALAILEQAITQSGALKLAENRAFVSSIAGDIIWSSDTKRARELFRAAGNELSSALNAPSEQETVLATPTGIENFSTFDRGKSDLLDLRRSILTTILSRDPDLAMELLLATRPADLAADMVAIPATDAPMSGADRINTVIVSGRVNQERALENEIASKIAERDPEKLAAFIRENLSKNLTGGLLQQVYKLVDKDTALGNKVIKEVFDKVNAIDNDRNMQRFAVTLLNTFNVTPQQKEKNKSLAKLKVDDLMLKSAANALANSLLRMTDPNGASMISLSLSVLQKLVPEKVAQLKQKQKALSKQGGGNRGGGGGVNIPSSFSDANASPEQLIADAAKIPASMREMSYRMAASRAVASGNGAKVRSQLAGKPGAEGAIAYIDSRISDQLLSGGKFDSAKATIDQMPNGPDKIDQLGKLAVAAYRSPVKEIQDSAFGYLTEARGIAKEFPENKDDADGMLRLIAAYSVIDAPQAFNMISPLIEQANEVINANAVIARYQKQTQYFKNGEMVMSANLNSGGSRVLRYVREINALALADYNRTQSLIEQFQRDDVRVFAKLFVAQALLRQQIGLSGNRNFSGAGIISIQR